MDWFAPIDPAKKNSEFIAVESKSFWRAAWGRFCKNPMAVLGLVVIIIMALVSVFGPIFSLCVRRPGYGEPVRGIFAGASAGNG